MKCFRIEIVWGKNCEKNHCEKNNEKAQAPGRVPADSFDNRDCGPPEVRHCDEEDSARRDEEGGGRGSGGASRKIEPGRNRGGNTGSLFYPQTAAYSYPKPKLIQYDSGITHTRRHAMVFLPADYDAAKTYPVLYLLHGWGGSHRTWANKKANIILQNLYYFEDVPEMIVVCPNSNVNAAESVEGLSFTESLEPFDATPEEVVKYLKPYIECHFSVKKGRKNAAVAGNSLGGRNALALAYKYPKQFGSVGSFSPSVSVEAANGTGLKAPLRDLNLPENKHRPFDVLMLMVGRSDKVCGNVSYELDRYMKAQNISHDFYDTAGGHETTVWQNGLYNFAKKLYRK